MEFLDVSNLLGQGFFADKVIRILTKNDQITTSEEDTLKRVKKFLGKIIEGQKEVKTEKLNHKSIENIDAYQKALDIFNRMLVQESKEMTAARFTDLMEKMSSELDLVLESKAVSEKSEVTLKFFKFIQVQTIHQTSDYLQKRAVMKWPKPTYSCNF